MNAGVVKGLVEIEQGIDIPGYSGARLVLAPLYPFD
jgi:hypothetical protein